MWLMIFGSYASNDSSFVLDVENKDVLHVDDRLDEIDLSNRARNTIEEEGVLFRVELVRVHEAFNKAAEDFNGSFVRDEETLAGVRSKELAGFARRSDATEDVARGECLRAVVAASFAPTVPLPEPGAPKIRTAEI